MPNENATRGYRYRHSSNRAPKHAPTDAWVPSSNPPDSMREVLLVLSISGRRSIALGHYNYDQHRFYQHDHSTSDVTEFTTHWRETPPLP